MLFMYLCEVAIVSQLCIFPLYLLHGLCEDYLTCDIAFNAVMPLSRASTRGRYSRIEGVISCSAPTHFLVNTGFTASLYKTICFDQLIKAYIPTPRCLHQSIDGSLELAHF